MPDTMETINCPACGKVMQKVFIQRGIAIDICTDGCGGMFFDNREIQELNDSQSDVEEIKKLLHGRNFIQVDDSKTRICPACGMNMAKTRMNGVLIDTCYNCNGLFLDYGEFEIVRNNFKRHTRVQQIDMDKETGINLRDFYKDAEDEKFLEEEGYRRIRQIAAGRKHKFSLLDIILSIIS